VQPARFSKIAGTLVFGLIGAVSRDGCISNGPVEPAELRNAAMSALVLRHKQLEVASFRTQCSVPNPAQPDYIDVMFTVSLMPDGLDTSLTQSEFTDLLAFLQAQQ